MNLNEFYEKVGGSLDEVMGRLMNEARIMKYLDKFRNSTEVQDFYTALNAEDYETAFRGAHSLKGMCANLGIGNLQRSSSDVCEALRPGVKPSGDISDLLAKMDEDYKTFNEAIKELMP